MFSGTNFKIQIVPWAGPSLLHLYFCLCLHLSTASLFCQSRAFPVLFCAFHPQLEKEKGLFVYSDGWYHRIIQGIMTICFSLSQR